MILLRTLCNRVHHVIRHGAVSNDTANPLLSANFYVRKKMFYVYILLLSNKKFYTGYTADLKRRLLEHQAGKSEFTSRYLPVKLVHYEAYYMESDARRRERYLKTTEGKRFLRLQIRDFIENSL